MPLNWTAVKLTVPGLLDRDAKEHLCFLFKHEDWGHLVAVCPDTSGLARGRYAIRVMRADSLVGDRVCVGGVPLFVAGAKQAREVGGKLAGLLVEGYELEDAKRLVVENWWDVAGQHWNVYAREMLDGLYVRHVRETVAAD